MRYGTPPVGSEELPKPAFSFPGLGTDGPPDIAVALFSFPNVEAYDRYRADVANDDRCTAATARFNETRCFSGYERTFLVPMFE